MRRVAAQIQPIKAWSEIKYILTRAIRLWEREVINVESFPEVLSLIDANEKLILLYHNPEIMRYKLAFCLVKLFT